MKQVTAKMLRNKNHRRPPPPSESTLAHRAKVFAAIREEKAYAKAQAAKVSP